MGRWPRDNQSELIEFYGNPGTGEVEKQLVPLVPPFRMKYNGQPIKHLLVHRKAYDAFKNAFDLIWDYYGQDQDIIDQLHISHTAGTFNVRKIAGSKTKWSNHSFGAAIDLDAERNGFYAKSTIPPPVIAAFKSQGMRWGGDYKSRKDPMHFECCSDGSPERTFEQWLEYYNQPLQYYKPFTLLDNDNKNNGVVLDSNAGVDIDEQTGDTDFTTPDEHNSELISNIGKTSFKEGKSLFKSKINWILQALGLTGGGAVISGDETLQHSLKQLITNPRFLWLVIIIMAVGFGMWFYWTDHGKGRR